MSAKTFRKITLYQVPLNNRDATEFIFKEALRSLQPPDYSGLIYIAPTPRKIRDAQKLFHKLVKNPYVPPRFFTLKQYAKIFFSSEVPGRILPQTAVPLLLSRLSEHGLGYASILSDVMKELKQHHPYKDFSVIRDELISLFIKLGIPADAVDRMTDALTLFQKYQKELAAHDLYDEDDVLNQGQSAVRRRMQPYPALILDGFYDMTESEKNLIHELISQARSSHISYPYESNLSIISDSYIDYLKCNFTVQEVSLSDNNKADFSYIGYGSIEDEIEGIARHIKSLSVAGRITGNSWIIVTFPRISDYRALTERVFRKYGLTYTISLQKPAISKRALRDVIYLLDCVADDFPRQKFTAVLSSPTFKNIPDVAKHSIISLSMNTGIVKGMDSWKKIFSDRLDPDSMKKIKDALHDVFRHLGSLITIRGSSEHATIRKEIEKALAELGYEAEQDALDELHNAFDTVALIAAISKNGTLSVRRYVDYMKHILSAAEYRHEDIGVQIMDFPETRGLAPDYLYFCGLKDGNMPSRPSLDHIFPDSIRTEYGLINLKTYLLIQKLNFRRLIGSSSHTHLSYPVVDGDKFFLPSAYLPWDKEVSENLYGIYSPEELLTTKQGKPLSDTIRQIRIDQTSREKLIKRKLSMPMRVTDIDSFRKCPRRFFIERVLNLEASEIARYEIEAKLLGTIIHDVMEQLIKEPLDDPAAVRHTASRITDTVLQNVRIDDFLKVLLKESFLEVLPDIVDIESKMRQEGFFPYEFEKRFEETVLPGISLKGRIDRLDRKEDTFRVIDYKTGTVQIGSDIITKGKNIQIALYAAMLKAHGMTVEKTGVYSLKDIVVKWIPTPRDRHILDDYIESSLRYLEEAVHEIQKGAFKAYPLDEFYCTTCPEAPFCPYIHGKDTSSHESIS